MNIYLIVFLIFLGILPLALDVHSSWLNVDGKGGAGEANPRFGGWLIDANGDTNVPHLIIVKLVYLAAAGAIAAIFYVFFDAGIYSLTIFPALIPVHAATIFSNYSIYFKNKRRRNGI